MPNLMNVSKEYIVDYLKRKGYVLLDVDGIIIEPDDIESNGFVDFHA